MENRSELWQVFDKKMGVPVCDGQYFESRPDAMDALVDLLIKDGSTYLPSDLEVRHPKDSVGVKIAGDLEAT
jgi:hypothetical protein